MQKEDCRFSAEWDYKGWQGLMPYATLYEYDAQADWNNTLITKINQLSAQIFQKSRNGGANEISLNSRMASVLSTYEYYNDIDKTLSGRYNVNIDNNVADGIIYIYRTISSMEIGFTKILSEGIGNITIKNDHWMDESPLVIEKMYLRGYIIVNNYSDDIELLALSKQKDILTAKWKASGLLDGLTGHYEGNTELFRCQLSYEISYDSQIELQTLIKSKQDMVIWNYKMPCGTNEELDLQNDWNQTLLSKFNFIREKHKNHFPEIIIVSVPEKYRELMETLAYYDITHSVLGDKYYIKFYDSSEDPKCHQRDAILFSTTRDCSTYCMSAKKCKEIKTFPIELLILNYNK